MKPYAMPPQVSRSLRSAHAILDRVDLVQVSRNPALLAELGRIQESIADLLLGVTRAGLRLADHEQPARPTRSAASSSSLAASLRRAERMPPS
jgi:hypothetical protein